MSNITQKPPSDLDDSQTLRGAFNDVDATITTNGFLVGAVGRQIVITISTTTVSGDTETYAFSENTIPLYSIKLIYVDGTRAQLISATRIS